MQYNKQTKAEILEGIDKEIIKSKFIANNTLAIQFSDGTGAIRYHNTNIITVNQNGDVTLNSDGWMTSTTKERLNTFTNNDFGIYQKNHIWYLGKKNDLLFYDGMTFNSLGKLITPKKKDNIKKINSMKRKINKYVKLIDTMESISQPNNGDCWLCLMQNNKNKSLGDLTGDTEHLKSHIKESYLFGSILVNAMREKGYNDRQISIHFQMNWKDSFKRALRQYLQKRLLK